MSGYWQKKTIDWMKRLRDLALAVLVIGGVQILVSLVLWLAFFRRYPQGFSMALSLVGFSGWFVGFASSIGVRRGMPRRGDYPHVSARQLSAPPQPPASIKIANPVVARFQEQLDRSGCGTVLFLSSLLLLALAFALRLQADMQSGKTWNDIFPKMP